MLSEGGQLSEFLEFEALPSHDSDAPPSDSGAPLPVIKPIPAPGLIISFALLSQGSSDADEEDKGDEEAPGKPQQQAVRTDDQFLSDSYADRSDEEPAVEAVVEEFRTPRETGDSESDSVSDFLQRNP
jgi:hypothetical protein